MRCVEDIASNNRPLLQNKSGYINPIKLAISFLDIGRGKIKRIPDKMHYKVLYRQSIRSLVF